MGHPGKQVSHRPCRIERAGVQHLTTARAKGPAPHVKILGSGCLREISDFESPLIEVL